MRFGILGTGTVGQTLGSRLVELGHEVTMGGRAAGGEKAAAWAAGAGAGAREGSFSDAAAFGEAIVNATAGTHSLQALEAAGEANLAGKLLIDVANALDTSQGMPPRLAIGDGDSLAEQIQRTFPRARVVKTLNTVNATIMVRPGVLPRPHTVFVCGDDAAAKEQVTDLLVAFGWDRGEVIDLGGIASARGVELYLALWVRLWTATGTPHLNVSVVTA